MLFNREIKRTVSYKKKLANKYKRQKLIADSIIGQWDMYEDKDNKAAYVKENMDLMNGVVDEDVYNAPLNLVIEGDDVNLGYAHVEHFPLIAKVAEAGVGEEILIPLKISVRDISNGVDNERTEMRRGMMRSYFNETVYNPIRESIIGEISQEMNIGELAPEEQQQIQDQVEQQVMSLSPEKIDDYMENEFKSLSEVQGQKIMNILYEALELKRKKTEAFEYAFGTAELYYHVGENHGEPFFKVIPPQKVVVDYTPGKPWAQDARSLMYEEEVTIQEAFSLDGEYLEKTDVKKLSELVHGYSSQGGDPRTTIDDYDERVLLEISEHPEKFQGLGSIDLHTQEGQSTMVRVYDTVLNNANYSGEGMYLTRTYAAWRDMAYFNRVKRRDQKTGEIDYFWEAETYVLNPAIGDVSMKVVEKEEVWEAVRYGFGDNAVYVKIRAVPNQRASLENIHIVQLPVFGGKINTRNGNATNVSNVDLGKTWNYEFDLQMAEYKLKQSSNLGKVFVMLKELKPETVDWGQWMNTMKYMKILLLEHRKEEEDINPMWANILKGVDLSTLNDISAAINMLNYTQQQLAESMHFSQERMGNIGQYMTATSSQSAINSSEIQTTRLFDTHNYLFTKACQYLLDVTRYAYKNNNYKSGLILDYISKADLEIDWEMLHRAELGVFLSISPDELKKVQRIKDRTLEIIQNQMMDVEDLFEFEMADTPAELKNLGKKITKKREKAQAEAQKAESEKMQGMIESQFQQFEKEANLKIQLQGEELKSKEKNILVDSMKFANQMDVNQNGVSDANESNAEDRILDKYKFDEEMKLKREALSITAKELAVKEKELAIKEKELAIKEREMSKNANKPKKEK